MNHQRSLIRKTIFADRRSKLRSMTGTLLRLSLLVLSGACDSASLKPEPPAEPNELFWDLRLDKHAILLSTAAPYDTITMTAVPHNYRDAVLAGLPVAQFASSNPDIVAVSNEGVAIGLRPGTVTLTATLVSGNLKHADTAVVLVVDDPSPVALGGLSIHPVPPDSAKFAVCGGEGNCGYFEMDKLIRLTGIDGLPHPYQGQAPVDLRVADTTQAAFCYSRYFLCGKRVGVVDVYASTTVFGTTKVDTLPFRLGWPLIAYLDVQPVASGASVNRFVEPALKLGVGGAVLFRNAGTTAATDFVFDDSTALGPARSIPWEGSFKFLVLLSCAAGALDCDATGNVFLGAPAGQAIRVFSRPGTYAYHSAMHGTDGKVMIVDESSTGP